RNASEGDVQVTAGAILRNDLGLGETGEGQGSEFKVFIGKLERDKTSVIARRAAKNPPPPPKPGPPPPKPPGPPPRPPLNPRGCKAAQPPSAGSSSPRKTFLKFFSDLLLE